MRNGTIHSLAAAAVLLAACGGSDSKAPAVTVKYEGPTTAATISGENIGTLATAALNAAQGVSGMTDGYAVVLGASRAPAAGVKQAIERFGAARRGGASLAGVVYSESGPCEGGGAARFSVSDADDDPYTTGNGDWYEVSFDRCTDPYDGTMIDGTVRIGITATGGGDPFEDPAYVVGKVAFGLDVTFTHFSIFEADGTFAALHGDVSVAYTVDGDLDEITYEISGQSIVAVEGYDGEITSASLLSGADGAGSSYSEELVERWDSAFYSIEEVAFGFNGRMCSTEIGGCLEIATDPLFAKYADDAYPYEGNLTITADNGAFVRIVAVDAAGAIEVSWDVDGPAGAAAEEGPYPASWSCLETASDSTTCFE